MFTKNKKIIIFYTIITVLIILVIIGFTGWTVKFLANGLKQALVYKESNNKGTQGFNFEGLKNIGIKEINDILSVALSPTSTVPTSTMSTSTSPTSTTSTSTKATSTSATSTGY